MDFKKLNRVAVIFPIKSLKELKTGETLFHFIGEILPVREK